MTRAWMAWAGLSVVVGLMSVAYFYPHYRLARDLDKARGQGVPVEFADVRRAIGSVRPEENAAELVETAIKADTADLRRLGKALAVESRVLTGRGSPEQEKALRALYVAEPDLVTRWQRVAVRPRLAFDRHWQDGIRLLFPEDAALRNAAERLTAAARLGLDPRRNLLAVAQLSILARQEPAIVPQTVAVVIGRMALAEAGREGIGREVEAALGPPIDARWAILLDIPVTCDVIRKAGPELDRDIYGPNPPSEGEGRVQSRRDVDAADRIVRDYQAFWAELPKEGTDYSKVRAACGRWLPAIDEERSRIHPELNELIDSSDAVDRALDRFEEFQRERQAIRKGGAAASSATVSAP